MVTIMADKSFDLIVIGSGPGGYVAAIRGAQLGMSVACVEKVSLGGTCLNIGCIPSKALLSASEKFHEAQHNFAQVGIKCADVSLDLDAMMAHKEKVVTDNVNGIHYLFKKNKVTHLQGLGTITKKGEVTVTADDGSKTAYGAKNILIATGSEVTPLPNVEIDEQKIVTSTGALELGNVPKKMVVIGGGVIGLELGSVWSRLGAEVTIVEFLDRILPGMDTDCAKEMMKVMKKDGVTFKLGTKVTAAEKTDAGVTLTVEPAKGGDAETLEADVVLVAIGRRPFTKGLGLEEVGVQTDERGRVVTNEHFKTSVDGIYAIGDVIAGPMLAHKAEEEGVICVEMMAGQKGHMNYNLVPGIVYTWPEVASIGKTEEQLKDAGIKYKVGKFPFSANGRARAMNDISGFVKIIADASTDEVLGAHMIGPDVGHLIAEVAAAMEFGASSEDIARTCHAHPTLSEVVKEAALAVEKRQIHL